jgi:hypothetical protein
MGLTHCDKLVSFDPGHVVDRTHRRRPAGRASPAARQCSCAETWFRSAPSRPRSSLCRTTLSFWLCWDKGVGPCEIKGGTVNHGVVGKRFRKYRQLVRHNSEKYCRAGLIKSLKLRVAARIVVRFPRGRLAFRLPEQPTSVVSNGPRKDSSWLRAYRVGYRPFASRTARPASSVLHFLGRRFFDCTSRLALSLSVNGLRIHQYACQPPLP